MRVEERKGVIGMTKDQRWPFSPLFPILKGSKEECGNICIRIHSKITEWILQNLYGSHASSLRINSGCILECIFIRTISEKSVIIVILHINTEINHLY